MAVDAWGFCSLKNLSVWNLFTSVNAKNSFEAGNIKPVLVIGKDGGPDENARFDKNINMIHCTLRYRMYKV